MTAVTLSQRQIQRGCSCIPLCTGLHYDSLWIPEVPKVHRNPFPLYIASQAHWHPSSSAAVFLAIPGLGETSKPLLNSPANLCKDWKQQEQRQQRWVRMGSPTWPTPLITGTGWRNRLPFATAAVHSWVQPLRSLVRGSRSVEKGMQPPLQCTWLLLHPLLINPGSAPALCYWET